MTRDRRRLTTRKPMVGRTGGRIAVWTAVGGTGGRIAVWTAVGLAGLLAAAACTGSAAEAGGAVFRVEIESCAGISNQRATAMAVGPSLVATAAHTFESARGAVVRDVHGDERSAEVVYLDVERDIALLSVDVSNGEVYTFAEAENDVDVSIPTYADLEGVEVKAATVIRSVNVTLDGEGQRRAVELAASIDQGDSGAPVVNNDGHAVGMVFASSRQEDRGWAVAAAEIEDAIETVASGDGERPPDRCRT